MKLETKSKTIFAVVTLSGHDGDDGYFFEITNDLYKVMDEIGAVRYAFILHNKDFHEDGTRKTPHFHIYAETTASGKRLGTYLNTISKGLGVSTLAVSIDKPTDKEACIQYLIHKNAPEKTQYDITSIRTNIPFDELKAIMEHEVTAWSVDYIREVWQNCFHCKWKFIKEIGLERFRLYHTAIKAVLEDLDFR